MLIASSQIWLVIFPFISAICTSVWRLVLILVASFPFSLVKSMCLLLSPQCCCLIPNWSVNHHQHGVASSSSIDPSGIHFLFFSPIFNHVPPFFAASRGAKLRSSWSLPHHRPGRRDTALCRPRSPWLCPVQGDWLLCTWVERAL